MLTPASDGFLLTNIKNRSLRFSSKLNWQLSLIRMRLTVKLSSTAWLSRLPISKCPPNFWIVLENIIMASVNIWVVANGNTQQFVHNWCLRAWVKLLNLIIAKPSNHKIQRSASSICRPRPRNTGTFPRLSRLPSINIGLFWIEPN